MSSNPGCPKSRPSGPSNITTSDPRAEKSSDCFPYQQQLSLPVNSSTPADSWGQNSGAPAKANFPIADPLFAGQPQAPKFQPNPPCSKFTG